MTITIDTGAVSIVTQKETTKMDWEDRDFVHSIKRRASELWREDQPGTGWTEENRDHYLVRAALEIERVDVAIEICDAVLQWIVKRDLGQFDDEFTAGDVTSILDDLWGDETDQPGDPKAAEAILRKLTAAPASVAEPVAWHPIETAPNDWSDILLFDPEYDDDFRKVFEGYYDADERTWRDRSGSLVFPTHWQPMPTPPLTIDT